MQLTAKTQGWKRSLRQLRVLRWLRVLRALRWMDGNHA